MIITSRSVGRRRQWKWVACLWPTQGAWERRDSQILTEKKDKTQKESQKDPLPKTHVPEPCLPNHFHHHHHPQHIPIPAQPTTFFFNSIKETFCPLVRRFNREKRGLRIRDPSHAMPGASGHQEPKKDLPSSTHLSFPFFLFLRGARDQLGLGEASISSSFPSISPTHTLLYIMRNHKQRKRGVVSGQINQMIFTKSFPSIPICRILSFNPINGRIDRCFCWDQTSVKAQTVQRRRQTSIKIFTYPNRAFFLNYLNSHQLS